MSTPITTIICDYGGVLTSPLAGAFAQVHARHGLPEAALGAAMAKAGAQRGQDLLAELECGRIAEAEFMALLGAQLSADLGREIDLSRFTEHYFAGLEANPEMLDELRELRAAGYRMGLLTNNVVEWEPHWRAMIPVDELFDDVVDSAFVGLRKPDPAIYRLSCERLGVHPAECVLIDDFLVNCQAAEALGMAAVRFVDTAGAIAELRRLLAERGAPPSVAAVSG
ncbi:MAG: HAD-superfamily hydrolase, subfamily variant 3 [Solirubrobacterales bacterium]|nr:HAD-superfamily hydrolase, subfamily variant 3 [Solirubrobacterales bacterium]